MVSLNPAGIPCKLGSEPDSIIYLEPELGSNSAPAKTFSRIKLKSVVDGVPEARWVRSPSWGPIRTRKDVCATENSRSLGGGLCRSRHCRDA